jgi:two-component system, LytTR family, response regulator AlgR
MNVLIVDDEQLARQRLRKLLTANGGYTIIGEAETGEDALLKTQKNHPDVVLMDIRMPGMDGIEAASYISRMEKPPAIIFTTAFSDHALSAFETHAIDYLLKPIKRSRLEAALDAAKRMNKAQLSQLLEKKQDSSRRNKICVKTRGSLELVPVEDILYFKADHKYVTLRTADDEYLIEESLKALELEFEQYFTRIHRNALIALNSVSGLIKNDTGHACIQFKDIDDTLEISRRHLAAIRKQLKR